MLNFYDIFLQINKSKVSIDIVNFLTYSTRNIIPSDNIIDNVSDYNNNQVIPNLKKFIIAIVNQSNVQTPTLLSTAVYLFRVKKILLANINDNSSNETRITGISTTLHRIFIGCLIIAGKNLNDSSPLNKHWANYTKGLLSLNEINKIEMEVLSLLNWKLHFNIQELIYVLRPLLLFYNEKNYLNWQRKNLLVSTENFSFLGISSTAANNTDNFTNNKKMISDKKDICANSFLSPQTKSHIRSDSSNSIPSLVSSNSISTFGDSPLKNSISISSPVINNNSNNNNDNSTITINNAYKTRLTMEYNGKTSNKLLINQEHSPLGSAFDGYNNANISNEIDNLQPVKKKKQSLFNIFNKKKVLH